MTSSDLTSMSRFRLSGVAQLILLGALMAPSSLWGHLFAHLGWMSSGSPERLASAGLLFGALLSSIVWLALIFLDRLKASAWTPMAFPLLCLPSIPATIGHLSLAQSLLHRFLV